MTDDCIASTLYEHFVLHNGEKTSLEKNAIEAFSKLLPNQNWRPSHPYYLEFGPIIQVGILAHILDGKVGAAPLLACLVQAMTNRTAADRTLLSELHAGALLTLRGGQVAFVKAGGQDGVRSPDLKCGFLGQNVDVEVVRADQRLAHEEHLRTMQTLTNVIHGEAATRYDIHIAVALTDDVLDQIVDAAASTPTGSEKEVLGQWCVAVRKAEDGGGTTPEFVPSWWKGSGPAFVVVKQTIGEHAPPRVQVKTTIPSAAYINPIRRKAERPQRSGNFPYVIALDASDLLGAPNQLATELGDWFALWPDPPCQ